MGRENGLPDFSKTQISAFFGPGSVDRRRLKAGIKLDHKARRIYHRLVREHSFTGCESNVRHYVRGAKVRLGLHAAKAFIPLDTEVGREAEVDWGTAQAVIAG
jgi:hypothetical protein